MRYRGQSYELEIPLDLPVTLASLAAAEQAFNEEHERRYGYRMEQAGVEMVTLRLEGVSPGAQPALPEEPLQDEPVEGALWGTAPVWFDRTEPVSIPCYDRERLRHGQAFEGPALILQYDTTLLVQAGWLARIDALKNLRLRRKPHAL
jgi:N-methylhydantoinase A